MRKVMVIDDDKEFLEEIDEMLNLSGYETVALAESRDAVKKIIKTKPDILVLDLKMEGVSGFEIVDELKRLPKTRNIPIIAITGFYTKKEHSLLVKISGIKKCITKPFNPLDIITAIEHTEFIEDKT